MICAHGFDGNCAGCGLGADAPAGLTSMPVASGAVGVGTVAALVVAAWWFLKKRKG